MIGQAPDALDTLTIDVKHYCTDAVHEEIVRMECVKSEVQCTDLPYQPRP